MDPQIDLISGLLIQPQQYMSVPTKQISLLTENMTKNAISKHLEKKSVKGIGEGDIDVDIKCGGKTMRICLSQVMHIPEAEGKILSLKILAQKGFQSHILADHIHISKDNTTYAEALLGKELYEVEMKVILSQESVLAAVKRDCAAADLYTWHWRLGHLVT